jgi:hypothetical protein
VADLLDYFGVLGCGIIIGWGFCDDFNSRKKTWGNYDNYQKTAPTFKGDREQRRKKQRREINSARALGKGVCRSHVPL